MFWKTLLTTALPLMLLFMEDESGEDKQTFKGIPFFSVRASETKSFTRVENGVLVSLGSKGTGVSQAMKRFSQAQVH